MHAINNSNFNGSNNYNNFAKQPMNITNLIAIQTPTSIFCSPYEKVNDFCLDALYHYFSCFSQCHFIEICYYIYYIDELLERREEDC